MSKFMDLVKEVVKQGIPVTLDWDPIHGNICADLNFEAKSYGHLHELEDGSLIVKMRYAKEEEVEDMGSLMYCFKQALCGREYGNQGWLDLCEKHGVLEKVVQTTVTYR